MPNKTKLDRQSPHEPEQSRVSAPALVEGGTENIIEEIGRVAADRRRVVFVSGNFNILHPGHLRLLNFAAECGDFLVVGVHADHSPNTLVPARLRLEGVRAISVVGYAFELQSPAEEIVRLLQPAVVVKGKEHELHDNPEQGVVDSYGGKLLFGSGEVRFSSLDLLQRELRETNFSTIYKPQDFPARHGFTMGDLGRVVRKFTSLKIVVIGDLIVDEYISCDPLGMSQEDPTIVVTPIKHDLFVGGAAIVAAHAKGLGARVNYFSVVGPDPTADYAKDTLTKYGVEAELLVDDSRPTTLKQRYRASGKTLLRVSHLRQHDMSQDLCDQLYERATEALKDADLLIFSDFSYGCLPQYLVNKVAGFCEDHEIMMVADSQASSQISDVSRFKGMRLLTPTEYEARLAMRDFTSGLVVLAEALRRQSQSQQLFVTLGAEGLLIHAPNSAGDEFLTDRLPALNTVPKDVSGAGDSLLTCAAMAMAVRADVWKSSYLGSIAAALQVSRVGNSPLSAADILTELAL